MSHYHPSLPNSRPFVVAHRAGNRVPDAVRAIQRGTDMLEADVWRYRKRLEVRHLKTMGPLPVLWDRWKLAPGWTPRLHVAELLQATPGDVPIMFDLKGEDPQLPTGIIRIMREQAPERAIIMCTRFWIQLDRIAREADVTRIYSVGDLNERDGIFGRLETVDHPAVSIHRNLVTPSLMRQLDDIGAVVMAWGATTRDEADLLLSLGVDGLTVSEGPLQDWLLAERQGRNGIATPGAAPTPTRRPS